MPVMSGCKVQEMYCLRILIGPNFDNMNSIFRSAHVSLEKSLMCSKCHTHNIYYVKLLFVPSAAGNLKNAGQLSQEVTLVFLHSPLPISLCGYKSDDNGVLETETKFNKRIAGLVRLYAAMIQTPSPPWDRRPHLLGVNRGWHWLAAVTRASPEPNLACTILFNFLEVAGWALGRDYGLQFRKALHMLCKDVFPRLKRESATTSGPVARLEGLLQETLRRGHLPKPQGCLGERVWD